MKFVIFVLYMLLVGAQNIHKAEYKARVHFYTHYIHPILIEYYLSKKGLFASSLTSCRPSHCLKCCSHAFVAAWL